jgi:hypothetical protein
MLLSVAGASSTLLEGRVPYAKRAFDGFVLPGSAPRYAGHVDRYVSAEGAVRLAAAAMDRCAHLALAETAAAVPLSPLLPSGAAITSAVSTLVARRGENSSFAAALTGTRCHVLGVRFAREAGRERAEEEELCGRLLVAASALAQEMPGDGLEGLFAALAPLKYLRLPAGGGEQASPAAAAFSTDGAPARLISAGNTAGVAAPANSSTSSSIDHRVPVSLPLDTVVHAEVPLPDPLDRLLGQGADAFIGAAAAAAASASAPGAQAPAAAAASATPAPASLRAAVLQWLPSVTHVLFSASHAVAPSAGAATAPLGASDSAVTLPLQHPVVQQQQIGNAALNNPPPPESAATTGGVPPARPLPTLLSVPGSFNPVHEGHLRMADAARSTLQRLWRERAGATNGGAHAAGSGSGSPVGSADAPVPIRVVFELSATNADKPPLARAEVLRRVQQFVPAAMAAAPIPASPSPFSPAPLGGAATPQPLTPLAASAPVAVEATEIVVTNAPRFVDKGRLFPGAAFVLGYDTAVRLIDPKYYGGSQDAMVEALLALKLQGTLILVAGRLVAPPASAAPATAPAASAVGAGAAAGLPTTSVAPAPHFMTLTDIRPRIPSLLQGLFVEISEADFRADVSSTELRARAAAGAAAAVSRY